jgi:hypothetical protein
VALDAAFFEEREDLLFKVNLGFDRGSHDA